ncbi:MAG: hypothetical protein ACXV2C_04920 [Candidatus Bathyarchaeia archaeon]
MRSAPDVFQRDLKVLYPASECAASTSWSVILGADGNARYFIIVRAVKAKSLMNVIRVHAVVLWLELWTAHVRPLVHGAKCNPFFVSAVFEVCAISTTLNAHIFPPNREYVSYMRDSLCVVT